MNRPIRTAELQAPEPPPASAEVSFPPPRAQATRAQRFGLLIGLFIAACLGLYLFASILLPFVAAACIAYFLDPPTTRLTRLGMPRGMAAVLMVVALVAVCLLFVLLLYPLILAQIGLLISRAPSYVADIRGWAGEVIAHLQERELVDGS